MRHFPACRDIGWQVSLLPYPLNHGVKLVFARERLAIRQGVRMYFASFFQNGSADGHPHAVHDADAAAPCELTSIPLCNGVDDSKKEKERLCHPGTLITVNVVVQGVMTLSLRSAKRAWMYLNCQTAALQKLSAELS